MCGGFVGTIIDDVGNAVTTVVDDLGNIIDTTVKDVINDAENLVSQVGQAISSAVNSAVTFFGNIITPAWQTLVSGVSDLAHDAGSFLKQYGHAILDIGANIILPGSSILIDVLWTEVANGWQTPSLGSLGAAAAYDFANELLPGVDDAISDIMPGVVGDVTAGALNTAVDTFASTGQLPTGQQLLEGLGASVLGDPDASGFVNDVSSTVEDALSQLLPGLGEGLQLIVSAEDTIAEIEDAVSAIEGMTQSQILALAGAGVSEIIGIDGDVILNAQQALALEAASMSVVAPLGDLVAVADAASQISQYTAAQIQALAVVGISVIQITSGDVISLDMSQITALENAGIGLVTAFGEAEVQFSDTVAQIESLGTNDIAKLAATGVTQILANASTALDLSQLLAIAGADISLDVPTGDVLSLVDTVSNIEALTAAQITDLAGSGLDLINSVYGSVSLDVSQAIAMVNAGIKISVPTGYFATLLDTAAQIEDYTASQLQQLKAAGIGIISATNSIALDAEQALAIAEDNLKLAVPLGAIASLEDTAANIEGLAVSQISALRAAGVTELNVLNGAIVMGVAQLEAIQSAGISIVTSTGVQILDTAAQILSLSSTQLAALRSAGVTAVSVLDTASDILSLNSSQLAALVSDGVASIKVSDTISDLSHLSSNQISALQAAGVAAYTVADTAANIQNLAHTIPAGITVSAWSVVDSAANIVSLTASRLTTLASTGVKNLVSTASSIAFQTVSQVEELEAAGIKVEASLGASISLSAAAASLESLAPSVLAQLGNIGLTEIVATDASLALSVAQTLALCQAGVEAVASATKQVSLSDTIANIASLTAAEIAELKTAGIQQITAVSANTPTLTVAFAVAQVLALEAAGLSVDGSGSAGTETDPGVLTDAAAKLETLTPTQIAAMRGQGIGELQVTDASLTLTVAQVQALLGAGLSIVLPAGATATVVDTAANIETLTAAEITTSGQVHFQQTIGTLGVSVIAASVGSVTLNLSQVLTLDAVGITVDAAPGSSVVLSAPKAEIDNLTLSQLNAAKAVGVKTIEDSDGGVDLTVAQAMSLENLGLTVSASTVGALGAGINAQRPVTPASVTLVDNAADLESLSATQIDDLKSVGVTNLGVQNNSSVALTPVAMTVAQVTALEQSGLAVIAPPGIALTDTAADFEAMTSSQITELTQAGVKSISITSGTLTLDVAQVAGLELGGLALSLVDTAADIENLTAPQIASLKGVQSITSSDGSVALDAEQIQALLSAQITIDVPPNDSIVLADTAQNILNATGAVLGQTRVVAVTDIIADLLNLTQPQLTQLTNLSVSWNVVDTAADILSNAASLVSKFKTTKISSWTVSDAAAAIKGLSNANIAALAADGVTVIRASDTSLVLTVSQALAAETANIKFQAPTNDSVTLADSSTNIEALTTSQLTGLKTIGVTIVNSTDSALQLTVAAASALAGVGITLETNGAPGVIFDTAANVQALSASTIHSLGLIGVRTIDSQGGVTLNVNQLLATEQAGITIVRFGVVSPGGGGSSVLPTVTDTASDIEGLTPGQIALLQDTGFSEVVASDAPVTLSVDQAVALETAGVLVKVPSGKSVGLTDFAYLIEAMTPQQISGLPAIGVKSIDALTPTGSSNGALVVEPVSLSLAQVNAIESAGVTIQGTLDGIFIGTVPPIPIVLTDTAANLESLTPAEITAAFNIGINGFQATDAPLSVNVAQALTYGPRTIWPSGPSGDSLTLADTAANIEALTSLQIDSLRPVGFSEIGIGQVVSVDRSLTLSMAQIVAFGGVAQVDTSFDPQLKILVPAGDSVSVSDTAANMLELFTECTQGSNGLSFAGLTAIGVSAYTVVDSVANLLGLTLAQVQQLKTGGVSSIVGEDTVANILNVSLGQLSTLKSSGLTGWIVADTASDIESLTQTQISDLVSLGVTSIIATNASVVMTAPLAEMMQSAGITVTAPAGGTVTISDTSANVAIFTSAEIRQINSGTNPESTIQSGVTSLGLSLTNVDPPPSLNLPSGFSVDSAGEIDFSFVPITITGAAGGSFSVTLQTSAGTLDTTTKGAATVSGEGTSDLVISGSLADVNHTLAELTFEQPSREGAVLNVAVSDGTFSASGEVQLAASTAGNPGPSQSLPGSQIVDATGVLRFGASGSNPIVVSDGVNVDLTTVLTVQGGTLTASALDSAVVQGSGTKSITLVGSATAINASLQTLVYQTVAGFTGVGTLTATTSDDVVSTEGSIGLSSELVDLAPSVQMPGGQIVGNQGTVSFGSAQGNAITIVDSSGHTITVSISVNDGILAVTPQGAASLLSADNQSSLLLSGAVADINATLGTLTYGSDAGFKAGDNLKITVTDGTLSTTAQTVVASEPDIAPANSTPGDQTIGPTGVLQFNAASADPIVISDPSGANLTVQMAVLHGTLSASQEGSDNVQAQALVTGAYELTITGSVSDINSSLATLTYQVDTGYAGADAIVLSSEDANFDTVSTINLLTTAPYVAPAIELPTVLTITAGVTLDFGPTSGEVISVSDGSNVLLTTTVSISVAAGTLSATEQGGAVVEQSASNGFSIVTITGTAADTNSVLNTLQLQTVSGASGQVTLQASVSDGTSQVQAQTQVSLPQHAVAPGQVLPGGQVLASSGRLSFNTTNNDAITVNAAAGGSLTTTLSVANGTLTATAASGANVSGTGTATLVVTGTAAAITATLSSLVYQENAGPGFGDTLNITTSDGTNTTSGQIWLSQTVAAPTNSVPGGQTLNANGMLTFSTANHNALQVADTANDTLTTFISVAHGSLALVSNAPAGVTVQTLSAGETSLTGTAANINAALNGLQYQSSTGYFGYDELRFYTETDNEVIGTVNTVGISPTVSDQAPRNTLPAAQVLSSTGSVSFSQANGNAITVSDAQPAALTATVTVGHGSLTAAAKGAASIQGSGSKLVITGSAADVTATLNTLSYQQTSGYFGNDVLTLDTSDGTYDSSNQVGLDVANEQGPGVSVPGSQRIVLGNVNFSATDGDALVVSDTVSNELTVTITAQQGTLSADAMGMAVVFGTANGLTVSGSVQDINATLNTLSYEENAQHFGGNDLLNVSVSDGTISASNSIALIGTDLGWSVTVPGAQVIGQTGTLSFSSSSGNPVAINDVSLGDMVATVSVQHGTLSVNASGHALVSSTGSTLTIAGTVQDINSTLNSLVYQQTPGYDGSDILEVTSTDGTNSASSSVVLASSNIGLIVNAADVLNGVSFTGTAQGGGQVSLQLYDQSGNAVQGQSYSATVIGNAWSVVSNLAGVADGTYALAATETIAGQTSAPELQTIVIHQTIPTVSLAPFDGGTVTLADAVSGILFSGSVTGLPAGTTFTVNVVGANLSTAVTAVVDPDGTTWTADLDPFQAQSLGNGLLTVTTRVTDAYGNSSLQVSQSAVVNEVLAGTLQVASGQQAFNEIVSAGDEIIVMSGGSASGTVVDNGGSEIIDFGGTLANGTVNSGGTLSVSGTANNTHIAGGTETIAGGGVATGSVIGNGGVEDVSSGGLETGVIVGTGGTQTISSGGQASSSLIEGGSVEIEAGASLLGGIAFSGNGTLKIDGTAMPSTTITGFSVGDTIDLTNVLFVSGASASLLSGNVLQVLDGGETFDLNLIPAQNFATSKYVVTTDNGQGLNITLAVPTPILDVNSVASGTRGEVFNLSKLVTVLDPGNVGYQTLQLWDSDGTVAGGEFKINGVAQTAGHAINVPTGANVVFDAGTSAGTDTLWAQLIQNDGTVTGWEKCTVTVPTPVLAVNNVSNGTRGEVFNLSSLAAVFDPGNVGYQMLQLWDSDGTVAGGEFLINGVAQTANHAINVPAGANVVFDAGTSAGTDTLWAQLIQANGTVTGWEKFAVTVPTPTVAVNSVASSTHGQVFNLSSLVTVFDSGNIGYQTLQVWDSDGTLAGGEFFINGVAQTAGHAINVPTGANVVFDAGTSAGTDTLWAQLIQDNGTATGWQKFTVTVPTPTLAVSNISSATHGTAINLSSLVTINNPGNVGSYQLQLWDSDGTTAGGEFLINGTPQTGSHAINVPVGANVVFDPGSSAGTDTLWAQLIQGGTVSGWDKFTLAVPNPTVAVHNDTTATPGQTIALSNLVTIFDPGNVGYQKLELWDSDGTVATGQFKVGGVGQTGGHEIDVSPANVASVVFDEGTTGNTDTLWAQLQLNNGTTTGWEKFTVVDPVEIAQGATLTLTGPYAGQAIFAGNAGTLLLDDSADFSGTVAGMTGADTIDLRDIGFGANTTLSYSPKAANTGGSLSLSDGTHSAQIALLGQYAASSFATASDGHGGTTIELQTSPLPMLAQSQHA